MNTDKKLYVAGGAEEIDKLIAPLKFKEVLLYTEVLLFSLKEKSDVPYSEDNQCGYLTVMNGRTCEIIFTLPFGLIPDDMESKLYHSSREQALRLSWRRKLDPESSDTTSYQSRKPGKGKLGGAVYADFGTAEFIFSFDGMIELKNEAMMMVLVDKLAMDYNHGLITQSEARGRNPYWTVLLHDLVNNDLLSMVNELLIAKEK